jgi:hypothetical protein
MSSNRKRTVYTALAGLCALAISAAVQVSTAQATDFPYQPPTAAETRTIPGKPYFIEFRARSALSYGHTFLVHGRVGQKITKDDVVGLHPISESPVPWMVGHLVPVISETGASDGDYEDEYVIARYRVFLTEAEYKDILAHMRYMQSHSPLWHAVLYNCSAFVGDVAKYMGLKAPFITVQYPADYINELKAMNDGRQELSAPFHPLSADAAARVASAKRGQKDQKEAATGSVSSRRQVAAAEPKQTATRSSASRTRHAAAILPPAEPQEQPTVEIRREWENVPPMPPAE